VNVAGACVDINEAVLTEGDSLTALGGATSYPVQATSTFSRYLALSNTAVPGSTTATVLSRITTDTAQLTAWAQWTGTPRVYSLMVGTNDSFNSVYYSDIQSICSSVTGTGASMIVLTNLPSTTGTEVSRQAWNTLIRNGGSCSYTVADVGNDSTIGQAGQNANLTYYQSDGIHPTAAGDAIIATYLKTALTGLGFN
jgi:lysophospholipase L1-like esterase